MKKQLIALLAAAMLLTAPLLLAFTDVQTDTPHQTAIDSLYAEGLLEGFPDGTYKPGDEITRAEFCKIIVSVFGGSARNSANAAASTFTDIDSHWAKEHIMAAASMGYVNGLGNGRFGPDEKLTCEQAIAIVVRAESGPRSSYPLDYLTYAMSEGISSGVPVVTGRNITRGEVAQIIYNIIERRAFEERESAILATLMDAQRDNNAYAPYPSATPAAPPISGGGPLYEIADEGLPMMAMTDAESPYIMVYPYEPYPGYHNTEEYLTNDENRFQSPLTSPLSTFSLDVNTASYSLIRGSLQNGRLPDRGAVKIEEMINYFQYDLEGPTNGDPFKVTTEVQPCPWNENHYLAMVALQGYDVGRAEMPPSNLVFLMDVSGSMYPPNRLPLAQRAMCMLVEELRPQDTVTIVVYASSTGTVLEPTSGSEKETIKNAIYGLRAGGSTNGAGGILLAYEEARRSFIEGGNNRVILCTDGDFNVGVSSVSALEDLIVEQRESGIFLSILGFGMGNIKDNKMETLATKGNGNYAYIDNLREAKKVLIDDMTGTIFTIAKDVKLQVEFNPATVEAYRLIGYEKRLLNDEDFADDTKDAGEMGAGHSMIAFYEIIPAGAGEVETGDLVYQTTQTTGSDEFMHIELRYKAPDGDTSVLMEPVAVTYAPNAPPSETFCFASAVAEWGLLLSDSAYKGDACVENVMARAYENRGADPFGYRAEFVQLVDLYSLVMKR